MNVLRSKSNLEVLSGRAEDDGVEFTDLRDDRIGSQSRRTEGAQGPNNLQSLAFWELILWNTQEWVGERATDAYSY